MVRISWAYALSHTASLALAVGALGIPFFAM